MTTQVQVPLNFQLSTYFGAINKSKRISKRIFKIQVTFHIQEQLISWYEIFSLANVLF